jgi:hypothetical protein
MTKLSLITVAFVAIAIMRELISLLRASGQPLPLDMSIAFISVYTIHFYELNIAAVQGHEVRPSEDQHIKSGVRNLAEALYPSLVSN